MAQAMNENQRLQALEAYNPQTHLMKIKARDGQQKDYYPAAWRFYELNLRYPNANFSTDLIYYDLEKNFCVVKCRLYLGADYDTSEKKAESMKQGLFTALDKVETASKARCLRDFGIGTEYALEFSDEDEDMETAARLTQPVATVRTRESRVNHATGEVTPSEEHTPEQNGTTSSPVTKVDPAAAKRLINPLKMKALKAGFISGNNDTELIRAWEEGKQAVFLREVTDAELIREEALRVQMRDAIDHFVQVHQPEQKAS